MKPRDWIAISVIGSSTFLIYTGFNGHVGELMLIVVLFYFGQSMIDKYRETYGSRNDLSLLYKKTPKR